LTLIEYTAIALLCLLASNWKTWQLGIRSGLDRAIEKNIAAGAVYMHEGELYYVDETT